MKRFFVIAVAAALAAFLGNNAWLYGSQGGGGGAAGGAAGAGAGSASAAASGTAGAAGTAGTAGTTGTAGTVGSQRAGAPGNVGARAINPNAAGVRGNAQVNTNFNAIPQAPFFSDPAVRSQLQLNNRQFNQLNTAYQRAYQRYNRSLNSPALRQQNLRTATGTGGAATTTGGTTPTVRNDKIELNDIRRSAPTTAANLAERQRLARLQQLEDQFNTDFNTSLDTTFTDPTLRQRFNQLNLQFQGASAFNNPVVQQQLKLTPQQRQQLTAINAEWRRELMNLQRGSRDRLTQQELDDLRARFISRTNTILTPVQQQLWMQLVGQPYNFPPSAFFPPTDSTPTVDGRTAVPQSSATQVPQTPTTVR